MSDQIIDQLDAEFQPSATVQNTLDYRRDIERRLEEWKYGAQLPINLKHRVICDDSGYDDSIASVKALVNAKSQAIRDDIDRKVLNSIAAVEAQINAKCQVISDGIDHKLDGIVAAVGAQINTRFQALGDDIDRKLNGIANDMKAQINTECQAFCDSIAEKMRHADPMEGTQSIVANDSNNGTPDANLFSVSDAVEQTSTDTEGVIGLVESSPTTLHPPARRIVLKRPKLEPPTDQPSASRPCTTVTRRVLRSGNQAYGNGWSKKRSIVRSIKEED